MKLRIAILAACASTLALAQVDGARSEPWDIYTPGGVLIPSKSLKKTPGPGTTKRSKVNTNQGTGGGLHEVMSGARIKF